jgi:pseudouridine-5'-phosphate glycosidase
MKELTAGQTLHANQALLINNAKVAAQIAVSLTKMK